MTGDNSNNHRGQQATGGVTERRRTPWPLMAVAAIFIIVPFMFWYGTWFGRELDDSEIEQYLREENNPRQTQHALSQLAGRMAKNDEVVRRWYPQLIALAGSNHTDVRMTAAWAMGQDNRAEEFRQPLRQLLQDSEPIVRRNAALSLVRFRDASGRPELLAMLRSYDVTAPVSGTLVSAHKEGTPIARESLLARVTDGEGNAHEVRSPLPGRIEKLTVIVEGSQIAIGEQLLTLAPDSNSVWESLRALYLIGIKEDLPEVERFARGVPGMSDEVRRQAVQTIEAINNRPSND